MIALGVITSQTEMIIYVVILALLLAGAIVALLGTILLAQRNEPAVRLNELINSLRKSRTASTSTTPSRRHLNADQISTDPSSSSNALPRIHPPASHQ